MAENKRLLTDDEIKESINIDIEPFKFESKYDERGFGYHTEKIIRAQEIAKLKAQDKKTRQAVAEEIKSGLYRIIGWRTDAPYKSTIDPADWDKFWKKYEVD